MNWLERKVVIYYLRKGSAMLDGKKTYIAGFGLIATALGLVAKMVVDGNYDNLQEAVVMFLNGLGLIGLRARLDK